MNMTKHTWEASSKRVRVRVREGVCARVRSLESCRLTCSRDAFFILRISRTLFIKSSKKKKRGWRNKDRGEKAKM